MIAKDNSQNVIYNSNNKSCPLCTRLNSICCHNQFQQYTILPECIGSGYYERTIIKPSIEIAICDMSFHDKIRMGGQKSRAKPSYNFSFFLGGAMRMLTKDHKFDYTAHCGDSFVIDGSTPFEVLEVDEDQHYSSIAIMLNNDVFNYMFTDTDIDNTLISSLDAKHIRRTSVSIQRIINDIVHCSLSGAVKRLYFEAKVIELLAVYIDEILLEDHVIKSTPFSKDDMQSVYMVKNIIDNDTANAPSLKALTRRVCLSEYKLQAGFKELFGMTVYAYVIDKRLEKARFLLEHGNIKVSDAAVFVGYNDLGRFSEKFRKKYGVNPSEYIKNT